MGTLVFDLNLRSQLAMP